MAKITDGTILAGGFTIDLDTAGITVIVDSYNISRPMKSIVQTDQNDEPTAAVHMNDIMTGSVNISVTAAAGQADFRGDTFTTTNITGSSQAFYIVSSDPSGSKSGLNTQTLSVVEKFS